jgi:hypothetical protein
VLGGVGIAGLGAGALLTYLGRKDNDALATCSPDCPTSSLSRIRAMYVAADISLAIGGATLAGSALFFLLSSRSEANPPKRALSVDVSPTRLGATAVVWGAF